jgi:hypothetical protein
MPETSKLATVSKQNSATLLTRVAVIMISFLLPLLMPSGISTTRVIVLVYFVNKIVVYFANHAKRGRLVAS